ncbi:MAG: cyclic nucleotide-binding domain-containing protein [Gammaproteobacteria bacterium]|nr:cyclic nucleotide-binding domain-containing protein [Gammaproteobacteria bacterium]
MTQQNALAETQTEPMLAPPALAPERIGKYYVIHEVGRGSTGTVYLSHDPFYGRDVAIKFYHATNTDDAESRNARRMFLGEAHMVGKLQHPNIVPIYDAGEEDGRRYVVTEHVHGARTLSAYTRPGSLLPIDQVVNIVYKCAKALHYAHSRGVVHRDIKPSNILLTQDGDVRIVDFGIALVSDSDISRLEGVAGSPAYMSPEQVQGHDLDSRSDIYSLGAVMYEMLCGHRPFRAGALGKLLRQVVQATPEPLRQVRPEIPEELEAVVHRALEKEPGKRYRNGAEFAADLTRVHQQLRSSQSDMDDEERFAVLRRLRFFHDFSHAEIREVMKAGCWMECQPGEAVLRPGDTDDRFYVVVSGRVRVGRGGEVVGRIENGGCFGEAAFAEGSRRDTVIEAEGPLTLLKVTATLLEQASISCQLRFHKVFLRELIGRLQRGKKKVDSG